MSYPTLISAAELRALPTEKRLLIDVGFDLTDPSAGQRAYAAAHLPCAHYLHLDRDLSATKTGTNGRHPLPDRAGFAAKLTALGLGADTQVVTYDAQGGMYAARLWWMLRWIGHSAAAVLDGGQAAWSGALTADLPITRPGNFKLGEPRAAQVDAPGLRQMLGQVVLIDARAPERFRGEIEPLDQQAGHIPGASNRLFKMNLAADGHFKPADQLRAEFSALLGAHRPGAVVHSCGSGVTACHNLLAMEHAGLAGSVLYPGSWSEWSSDSLRPVAKG